MTTLFRSPNILVDAHEWHLAVVRVKGRVYTQYRWREPGRMWQHITAWPGRLPKGLARFFRPYQRGVRVARGELAAGTRRAA